MTPHELKMAVAAVLSKPGNRVEEIYEIFQKEVSKVLDRLKVETDINAALNELAENYGLPNIE